MPVPRSLLHKASAKKAKTNKDASKRVLLERCCYDNGLEELTFRSYVHVSKDGTQTVLEPKQVVGNLREGIMLIQVESTNTISETYDLVTLKENLREPKQDKSWLNFKAKVAKIYDLTLLETEYFDLLVDSTSMVIEKPLIYTFADYYLVFGRLDRKKSVAKRLAPSYGTEEALLEQVEDLPTLEKVE